MARFTTPEPKKKYQYEIENFLGIDLSTAPNNVAKNRSPSCPNMVRDTVGKVKKRDGITLIKSFDGTGDGKINGKHSLYNGSTVKRIIHTGTNIYLDEPVPTLLYSTANDHISVSKQINGKLWILDGANYIVFDGTAIKSASIGATVPTILIARTPTGGGTPLQEINLIQPKMTVRFAGTISDKVYYLPHASINSVDEVKKLNANGTFSTLVLNTDYTVDTTAGKVTFTIEPGISPITGEDNVYITYSKTITGYADRINKCDVSILYGMNGARDRMFVAGNPDLPNYDYYSDINNPTYFGDLSYSVIGQDNSAIMNYSIINEYLVTHKNDSEDGANTNLRKGTLVNNKVVFTSEGSYQTSGALAKYSFAQLENEPLYVTTEKNISAVTPSDVLGERFSQERSYYITEALKAEPNIANSFAYTFNGFY